MGASEVIVEFTPKREKYDLWSEWAPVKSSWSSLQSEKNRICGVNGRQRSFEEVHSKVRKIGLVE